MYPFVNIDWIQFSSLELWHESNGTQIVYFSKFIWNNVHKIYKAGYQLHVTYCSDISLQNIDYRRQVGDIIYVAETLT